MRYSALFRNASSQFCWWSGRKKLKVKTYWFGSPGAQESTWALPDRVLQRGELSSHYLISMMNWGPYCNRWCGATAESLSIKGHLCSFCSLADFDGNPATTIIILYPPLNVAPIEEVEKYYGDLKTALRDVPSHNFLNIVGDFNARLVP